MQAVLTVRRWRRYGVDRLVVLAATGETLGSVDLESGEVLVDEPQLEPDVRLAAQEFLRRQGDEVVLPAPRPPVDGLTAADEALLEQWLRAPVPPRGAGGSTRARLDRLAETGWTVLHELPVGLLGAACDHLVIGPAGVLTLAERGRAGQRVEVVGRRVVIDGTSTVLLRDAVLEARRVRELLRAAGSGPVQVRPVLVVPDVVEPLLLAGPVLVAARDMIVGTLRTLPAVLDPDRAQMLARVASRPDTWLHATARRGA